MRTNIAHYLSNFYSEPLENLSSDVVWMTLTLFGGGIQFWNESIIDTCLQGLSNLFNLLKWGADTEPFKNVVKILSEIIINRLDYVNYLLMIFDLDRLLSPLLTSEHEEV